MSSTAGPDQATPAPSSFAADPTRPLQGDLYGLANLEVHARRLAEACRTTGTGRGDHLLRRFVRNGAELTQAYRHIAASAARGEPISPDAEWLLDNFHIIEETLREVRHDLPRGYSNQLPKLMAGPLTGLPRVYLLAMELIAHTDSSLDENRITRFVQAWQPVAPLTIGEVWAVPTMLRLGLIENLCALARQMVQTWDARRKGEAWAQRLQAESLPEPATLHTHPDWTDPCVVRLAQALRDRGPEGCPVVEWLERLLEHRGVCAEEVLWREHRRQATSQVSVGNCVTSLRLLSNLDWTVFFERISVVEAVLRRDPAAIYARQDFATRDRLRRLVERLGRGSTLDEVAVARRALALAERGGPSPRDHVGYYLDGPGRPELEAEVEYRPRLGHCLLRGILRHPGAVYSLSLATVGLVLLAGVVLYAAVRPGASVGLVVLAATAALLPVAELAVGLVHYLLTLVLPPRVLPKLDFKDGIPEDCATFVVMPTLLVSPESGALLAERLEVHYLSNPDPTLRFALLTDFADAPTEHRPEDEGYVQSALDHIRALNERYAAGAPDRFYLFHRKRQWNPAQGCWMGWERKRGKLSEFNRLLRGATDTNYVVQSGQVSRLPRVRFVITLDADTQLPREAAGRLVATLAHPLNRPVFDPARGRVVAGHGVLQPRVGLSMVAANRTRFSRLLACSAGIDPYTTAVSDVYQDLFGRGTFTGKGIYDVDAFEAAVGHTFPENRILSHDLIEGNYARCGLVTDVELLDDFPSRYHAYARREHRWVRGDWQILSWMLPRVPVPPSPPAPLPQRGEGSNRSPLSPWGRGVGGEGAAGPPRRNPLPGLERWKIFDNLRRSLTPPALVILLALGWTVLPGSSLFWTALALAVPLLPLLLLLLASAIKLTGGGSWRLRILELRSCVGSTAGQGLLQIIFLAEQARQMADAILRTLYRLTISKRHLLEWETAASTERRLGTGFAHFCATLWAGPLVALAIGATVGLVHAPALFVAVPILLGWLLSPAVAFYVSCPAAAAEAPLSPGERQELRRLARKTWHFFETFVCPEDHWLPPDNYQEDPKEGVAHRTSPTNIGLYLLSCASAHDLGYLSLSDLTERLEQTFESLEQLERFRGHFYNWYDTQTFKVLPPAYVSTVDSGNLLGCLLTLRQALLQKMHAPQVNPAICDGLADTWGLLEEALRSLEKPRSDPSDIFAKLNATAEEGGRLVRRCPADASSRQEWLSQLQTVVGEMGRLAMELSGLLGEEPQELRRWINALQKLQKGSETVSPARLEALAARAEQLAARMNFRFLYNRQRHLFSIGYNRAHSKLDNAHYDLLASEASLTSFVAIARGDVPRRHWYQLGRQLTRAGRGVALVSWGGTMFEYLMPHLLLPAFRGTLVEESLEAAVDAQVEYARRQRVPWGISESGYYAFDAAQDYQYQSFGVPSLGLKRGLGRDLVVAPYATLLALAVRPHAAAANLQALRAAGAEGPFGLYEAIDYTRDRLPEGSTSAVIQSYMAHHQGMGMLALANALLGNVTVRRFHAEPMVRATELLLQERLPAVAPVVEAPAEEVPAPPVVRDAALPMSRLLTTPDTPHPRTHLLSGGAYSVQLTGAGSGCSSYHGLVVTRWREDRTADAWGQFCYIRDLTSGEVWSATHQPVCRPADQYEVVFATDKAEFRRRDEAIETLLEVTVSPENATEVRRLTLTNHDSRPRELELTSYAEVVLLPQRADLAHPGFGKLFLETEWVPHVGALLCRRRPREAGQKPLWCVHVLAVDGAADGVLGYETDRARFLGRGRSPAAPAAFDPGASLSGTTGAVLDPIVSLRTVLRLPPGTSAGVAFTTAVAISREEALALADRYHDYHGVHRAFELSWAHSQLQLRHLHLTAEAAHVFQRLAAHVIYAGPTLRAPADVLDANRQGVEGLWRHGISGDNPIVLLRVADERELPLMRQTLLAHAWCRLQGLVMDLVVLNEHAAGYREELQQQLQALARASDSHALIDKPGGIFLRQADQIPSEDRILLQAAARVVLLGNRGSLALQVEQAESRPSLPERIPVPLCRPSPPAPLPLPAGLRLANGFGGFSPDGRDYIVAVPSAEGVPPAPWTNVVANPQCGFVITEGGGGYTWAGNSQQNRLTPWSNDPVRDPPGEVVYLRDEDTGALWTPTPRLLPAAGTLVRHGPGYTAFEQDAPGLHQELMLFVPPEDAVKVLRLRLRNTGDRPRRLTAVFFAEWVLGTVRDQAPMQVSTAVDAETGALVARNPFQTDFPGAIAFADVNLHPRTVTGDRTEFLGRNGSLEHPAALERIGLSGHTGPGLDPCAALMAPFELAAGEEREVIFLLGQGEDLDTARTLLRRYQDPAAVAEALDEVGRRWHQVLETIQVKTPNEALDLLLNRWLLYQVLACRVWGRSAFYQSGGAYGFRDQLQDVMSLVEAAPVEVRAQLLRAAARQFREGDVQHWWHPPAGKGVRTRVSDDFLWLPFVALHYLETTGDTAVLDERVPFLEAPLLKEGQEEDYGSPTVSAETAPLYEHCARAMEHGLRYGVHGLPLMGIGDWNDGLNKVGAGGKGESVWDAWFQLSILPRLAAVAEKRGDTARAGRWRSEAERLRKAVEEQAWDGEWYRRAYFDDGTPLGSATNDECQIDSLPQTWAVMSGAGDPGRARQAMDQVERRLVRSEDGLILLFTPPFDQGPLQPGYIKGYVPGIRENGGQYTHASTWVVQATALLGQGGRAVELFDLLNPLSHSSTPEAVKRYKVEPYVVAADVYGVPPHTGRGGWTWYTGSASWLYRVGLESILGFRRQGNRLRLDPCIPAAWPGYEITYRYRSTTYHIVVENPLGVERGVGHVEIDGVEVQEGTVVLADDGQDHQVRVRLG
jgi:cyclic beta-1,2-glucan synthetase